MRLPIPLVLLLASAASILALPGPVLASGEDPPKEDPAPGPGPASKGGAPGEGADGAKALPAAEGREGAVRFVEIAAGCIAATAPDGESSAGAVLGKEAVALIDCLGRPERTRALLAEIARRTDKPIRYLVYTHGHVDHTVGSQELPEGVEVLGTEETRKEVDRVRDEAEKTFGKTPKAHAGVGVGKILRVTRVVKGQADLDLGGTTLRVYETGHAHSPGDLVALVPEVKVLYSGDLVFSGVHPDLSTARTFPWLAAIAAVERLEPEFVVPGHGPPGGKELLESQREYIMGLRRVVKHLMENRTSVQDILLKLEMPEEMKNLGRAPRWSDNVAWIIREIAEGR